MDLQLTGKTAIVFGGSRGLGRAVAAELTAEGAQVVVVARDAERTQRTAADIGALPLIGDLSQPGAGETLTLAAAQLLGDGPDIVVTNTGGPAPGEFETISNAAWRQGFENLWMSFVDSVQTALPRMRERGWGRIIAITSVAAKEPQPSLAVSNSLRAGLLGLVNSLSREVAADGITVNALLPGYTDTDRMAELGVDKEALSRRIPAGRLGLPAEFAAVAAFLASNRASYLTGQAIAVDGGLLNSI